jgi:hypothetical protein
MMLCFPRSGILGKQNVEQSASNADTLSGFDFMFTLPVEMQPFGNVGVGPETGRILEMSKG